MFLIRALPKQTFVLVSGLGLARVCFVVATGVRHLGPRGRSDSDGLSERGGNVNRLLVILIKFLPQVQRLYRRTRAEDWKLVV